MQQISLPAMGVIGRSTQVLYRWGLWQQRNSPSYLPNRIAVFRKEDRKLIVHEYGNICGILTMADVRPRIVDFREWREPLARVARKLGDRGWQLVSDGDEVMHGRH